jgi:hypothetical protein
MKCLNNDINIQLHNYMKLRNVAIFRPLIEQKHISLLPCFNDMRQTNIHLVKAARVLREHYNRLH